MVTSWLRNCNWKFLCYFSTLLLELLFTYIYILDASQPSAVGRKMFDFV